MQINIYQNGSPLSKWNKQFDTIGYNLTIFNGNNIKSTNQKSGLVFDHFFKSLNFKIMQDQKERKIKELQEKIMAKRQQIEFDKTEMDLTTEFSSENNENPDVSEDFKNVYDPAANVIDTGESKDLSNAESELIHLIDRLNKLRNE